MANQTSSETSSASETQAEQAGMKRKLAWRMGFAGVMIVMLLGTLAVFDRLSAPDEPESSAPQFTEPVPVPKKEITQPVKPAEPAPEAKPAEPEATSAPPEAPARPEVAAQPALPRAQSSVESRTMPLSRPQPPAPALPAAPASAPSAAPAPAPTPPTSAPTQPPRAAVPAPVASQPAAPVPAPAPAPAPAAGSTLGGRLFSGFALQAGVFSDVRLAEELHAKLTLNGIPSTLEARVQVGPFRTREEAEAARAKMKTLGIDAVLLTPPKGALRR